MKNSFVARLLVSQDEQKSPKDFPLEAYSFVRSSLDNLTGGSASFLISFFQFLYMRSRAFLLWFVVTFEVFVQFLSNLKDNIVSSMFWGRSSKYRLAVQVFGVFLIGGFAMLSFSRQSQLVVSAQPVDFQSIEVASNDLIVENGSTQTLIPKSRGRLDTLSYTVQGGDTISTIAEKFGLKSTTILWSNDLSEGDFIKPGQVLEIPEGDGVLHEVESGDSLESIAKEYNSSAQGIAQVNWIDDPSQLVVGETVFVPNGEVKVEKPQPVVASSGSSRGSGSGVSLGSVPTNTTRPDPSGGSLSWPVLGGGGRLTQCPSWYHKAIDIADRSYPYIGAARSGTVVFAGVRDPYGYGREIIIDHGGGIYTQYAHLSAWSVSTGQRVSTGQVIGRMGRSGLSTGVHLHFEVRVGGSSYAYRVINPQSYLTARVC